MRGGREWNMDTLHKDVNKRTCDGYCTLAVPTITGTKDIQQARERLFCLYCVSRHAVHPASDPTVYT